MYKIGKKNTILGIGILCMAFNANAGSGTNIDTINVTATIGDSCAFGTTLGSGTGQSTNLAFGSYVSTAASTATASLSVTCTNGTSYNISLDAGLHASAGFSRRMQGSNVSDFLTYNLGTSSTNASSGSPIWGDNTGGSNYYSATSTGTTDTVTVYGYVPSGQSSPVGSYTDTVTATLSF